MKGIATLLTALLGFSMASAGMAVYIRVQEAALRPASLAAQAAARAAGLAETPHEETVIVHPDDGVDAPMEATVLPTPAPAPSAAAPAPRRGDARPPAGGTPKRQGARGTGRGFALYVPGVPDVPLARQEALLAALPGWRVEQGLYSGTELARWAETGDYVFVSNDTPVEVLERQGERVLVRTAGASGEPLTGWTYDRFVRAGRH